MRTKFLILIAFVLSAISSYSQDIIFEKDGTTIWANVLKCSKDNIIYELYEKPERGVQLLSAEYVVKVEYDSTERNTDSLEFVAYLKTFPVMDTVTVSNAVVDAGSPTVVKDNNNDIPHIPISPKKRRARWIRGISITVGIVGLICYGFYEGMKNFTLGGTGSFRIGI